MLNTVTHSVFAAAVAAVTVPAAAQVTVTLDPADITPTFTQSFDGVPNQDLGDLLETQDIDLNPILPATASSTATDIFNDDFGYDG